LEVGQATKVSVTMKNTGGNVWKIDSDNMRSNMKRIKQKVLPILKQHKVNRAALFGSCVKGTLKKSSDIDILVDIKKNISLLDFVGIKLELEEALNRKVDLVEYSTIKRLLRKKILQQQVKIL